VREHRFTIDRLRALELTPLVRIIGLGVETVRSQSGGALLGDAKTKGETFLSQTKKLRYLDLFSRHTGSCCSAYSARTCMQMGLTCRAAYLGLWSPPASTSV
jgi:hypothetical protein